MHRCIYVCIYKCIMTHLMRLLLLVLCALNLSLAEDHIIACNGFVKSQYPIDISKVNIKLISKEGNLKERVECAPNNWYYFLPIYDKGEYTIKVDSPDGWVFEPEEFHLSIDGVSDVCSKGVDVNFVFKGYSIYGSVFDTNGNAAEKVRVSLSSFGQNEEFSRITGKDGSFIFTPVDPGKYTIRASHPRWRIKKGEVSFTVANGNYHLPDDSLSVSGYDVCGVVQSDGVPIGQVTFVLFAADKNSKAQSKSLGCDDTLENSLGNFASKLTQGKQLCHVKSQKDGKFCFDGVPSGKYEVVPFYKDNNGIKLDVQPKIVSFQVETDSFAFESPFEVAGFSVMGRVSTGPKNGNPIKDLKIIVNGKPTALTSADGTFILEGMKTDVYHIEVKSPDGDMMFDEISTKVSPNDAINMMNIYPASFRVRGSVKLLEEIGEKVFVKFQNERGNVFKSKVDGMGDFYAFLPPGIYVTTLIVENSATNQYWFSPSSIDVRVQNQPISDLNFRQLRADLTGSIICEATKCDDFSVKLNFPNGTLIQNTIAKDGKYKFENLSVGEYRVSLSEDDVWCWERNNLPAFVSELHSVVPPFKRIGPKLPVESSHAHKLTYENLSQNKGAIAKGQLDVEKGLNEFCLPNLDGNSSTFVLKPEGCHQFQNVAITWSVGGGLVKMDAISHSVTFIILAEKIVEDLRVEVVYVSDSRSKIIGPVKPSDKKNSKGQYIYEINIQTDNGESVQLFPTSKSLLFTPKFVDANSVNDCVDLGMAFTSIIAREYKGSVRPPIGDVTIEMMDFTDTVIASTMTDENGRYGFPSLPLRNNYRLIAKKEGYVFNEPDENGIIKVQKLAEIKVSLNVDGGIPLQGAWVSISSGSEYRQTGVTDAAGICSFKALKEGEYYVKPILKEYTFSPLSTLVTVTEGATQNVPFSAVRIAYSVLGNVKTLGGLSESQVVVEAISSDAAISRGGNQNGANCTQHQEEAISDRDGKFRIKALHPNCEYYVQLKRNHAANDRISTTIPGKISIQMGSTDVHISDLVVIPKIFWCDVTLFVELENPEHAHTLTVKMIKDGELAASPVKFANWKNSKYEMKSLMVALPTVPMDNKTYIIKVDSSLPSAAYDFQPISKSFVANESYQMVKVKFKAKSKFATEKDSSLQAAIVIFSAGLLYLLKDSISARSITQVYSKLFSKNQRNIMARFNRLKSYVVSKKPGATISGSSISLDELDGSPKKKTKSKKA